MSDDPDGCEPTELETTGPTPAEPEPEPEPTPPGAGSSDTWPLAPVAGPVPEEDDVEAVEETAPQTVGRVDDLVESVRHLGDRLGQKLDALQTLFDREIRAEATREKVVDRLHAELQEYKQDLLLNTLRPVFIDLIQLHDDIGKVAVAAPETGPEAARLIGLMQGFQQGIEDILYRQGVEPYVVDGDAFDPRRQRAVATVATDDPARGKTVAARLRKGFQAGDRVLRAEVVSVFAYKPGP
jgi:molecular chaperone GrpE